MLAQPRGKDRPTLAEGSQMTSSGAGFRISICFEPIFFEGSVLSYSKGAGHSRTAPDA
jgi:hypothetical protein